MTTPPLDLPALRERIESIPPNGESAMKGMAFPATALPELWTLRHIARVDAPALLEYAEANRKGWGELLNDFARMEDRAIAAEKAVARVEAICQDTDGNWLDPEDECNNVGSILQAVRGGA